MARSIQTIQNSILTAIQNDSVLSALDSTSQTSIFNLWTYIIASILATEEQLNDQLKIDVEAIAAVLPPATAAWIQNKAFQFQYSATDPQIINLDLTTFVPFYPTGINKALRIITNCSVFNGPLNSVYIKTAKGSITAPSVLTNDELSALQYYFNLIKPAGIAYICTSNISDKLCIALNIKYLGIYSSTIAESLLSVYKSFLQNIPFDGKLILLDLLVALRNVKGVIDIIINSAVARSNGTAFGGGVSMVSANKWLVAEYQTFAGYIIDETTTSNDFLSLLTLQPI